jgi:hypothetical protein
MSADDQRELLAGIAVDLKRTADRIDRYLKNSDRTVSDPYPFKCRPCKGLGFSTERLLEDHRENVHAVYEGAT